MLKHYLLLCLLSVSTLYAAEEKKIEEQAEEITTSEPIQPDKEKEISTLIEKNLHAGEAEWLDSTEDPFLALYKENTWKETQGAILLLHDLGANADWPQLIQPLRLKFPEKGWHTLSLQLPRLKPEQEKYDYLSSLDEAILRVNAGIEFLQQKGISNIVIVGHGIGAAVGIFYINQNPQAPVTALSAISLPGTYTFKTPRVTDTSEKISDPVSNPDDSKKAEEKQANKQPSPPPATAPLKTKQILDRDLLSEMGQIKIPFLDIYALQDHQDVVREAKKRSEIMHKSKNKSYSQRQIEGTDHYFHGTENQLFKQMRGWLQKNAQGLEIQRPPPS